MPKTLSLLLLLTYPGFFPKLIDLAVQQYLAA